MRDWLSFSASIRSLVDSLNREIEDPEKLQIRLPSHPAGFVRAISKRRLTMAEAYLKLVASRGPEHYLQRLEALSVLTDHAWHAKTWSMPINTARVQISLMKECVQARGDLRRQLELMSDFALASYGQEVVIRRLLRELDLIEVPEVGKPLRELHLGWDGHLHDLLSQGTKTPSQLLADAFIKGISRLTVVYYDLSDPRVFEEALEAGRILGIDVEVAIEFSVGPRGQRLHYMFIPPQDGTPEGLKRFLDRNREVLRPFFEGLVVNSVGRKDTIADLLEEFNRTHLAEINSRFRNIPFLQVQPLRMEELEDALRWGQASHIHLGQVVTEHIKELLHKRVLYLKNQYFHAVHRLVRGEFSSWEVDNLRSEYERARQEYNDCRPDKMTERFGGVSHRRGDYDSAFPDLQQLHFLVDECQGRLVFIHPLSQGSRAAVQALLDHHRLISEVETFNASDSLFRDPSDVRRLNRLVELLGLGNADEVVNLLGDWALAGVDAAAIETACRWYAEHPLAARCGSDYIGGISQIPGMGFVFASDLNRSSRALLEKNRHPTLPVSIGRLMGQQHGRECAPRATLGGVGPGAGPAAGSGSGNGVGSGHGAPCERLYVLSRPKPPVPNPVGDEHVYTKLGMTRFWRYLNPNLKGLLKILIGFTPAYLLVGPWYAALWLGITGVRNIMADLISTSGLTLRLWRSDNVDKNNVANSMFWTGFSVPVLTVAKQGFDHGWPLLFSSTSGFLFTLTKFWVIAFANGLYITTHNRIRGFDRRVIRVNFFRTVLSWPLATAGSFGLDGFGIPAIVQSKIWSDVVAGLIEGTSKFISRLKLRQRDLLELFHTFVCGNRTAALVSMIDILYVWAKRDRGRSAFDKLLRGKIRQLSPTVGVMPLEEERRLVSLAYDKLQLAFATEGSMEMLTTLVLQHFTGRDAVILSMLIGETHGEFSEWLEHHRPRALAGGEAKPAEPAPPAPRVPRPAPPADLRN